MTPPYSNCNGSTAIHSVMAIILLIAILQVVAATEYYVSVEDGSDNNPVL